MLLSKVGCTDEVDSVDGGQVCSTSRVETGSGVEGVDGMTITELASVGGVGSLVEIVPSNSGIQTGNDCGSSKAVGIGSLVEVAVSGSGEHLTGLFFGFASTEAALDAVCFTMASVKGICSRGGGASDSVCCSGSKMSRGKEEESFSSDFPVGVVDVFEWETFCLLGLEFVLVCCSFELESFFFFGCGSINLDCVTLDMVLM